MSQKSNQQFQLLVKEEREHQKKIQSIKNLINNQEDQDIQSEEHLDHFTLDR